MKIGCDWKRKNDKVRFFSMTFVSMYDLSKFFESFLEKDTQGEILELRIWKED